MFRNIFMQIKENIKLKHKALDFFLLGERKKSNSLISLWGIDFEL